MNEYKLKPQPTAVSKEQNSQKNPKANRILIGVDAHLKSYEAARKIDNGAVGVAQSFRSKEAFLLYVEKQREQAEEVAVGYEDAALGFTLYREVQANDNQCPGCVPRRRATPKEQGDDKSIRTPTISTR